MTWELPENPNPPDTICVQLQVPNDPAYIAAFWGVILDLSAGFNWANDSAHTAKLAAKRMRQMYLQAQFGNCPPPCADNGPGFQLVNDMNVKQDPNNPCLLREVCPDGSLGCTIFDASLCKPNTAPGAGTTPPVGGACQDYEFLVDTSVPTLMPFLVNTGDTLKIDKATGAAAELYVWYCPDGEYYLLGGCAGGAHTAGADPVNTFPHMALIWKIGSNFYGSAIGSTFTVPGGVTEAMVWLQVNTSSLADVSGQERVDITFCNNSAPPATTWCQLLDFTLSPHGANARIEANGGACGTPTQAWGQWVAGAGLEGTQTTQLDCTHGLSFGDFIIDLGAAFTFASAEMKGNLNQASGSNQVAIQVSNDPTFASGVTNMVNVVGDPAGNYDHSGSATPTARYIRIYLFTEGGTGGTSALATCTSLKLTGTGTNPFGSSNC